MISRRRRQDKHKGAAAVEFAVVAPILFLFLAGIVEFGRMTMVKNFAVSASREAARKAILPSADAGAIEQSTETFLETANINNPDVTFDPANLSTVSEGEEVKVLIEIEPGDVTWLPNVVFMGNTIKVSTTMRREY